MPTKKNTLFTVYLGLIALISFIGLSITVIIFTQKLISTNIITNDEYIAQNHRELERCEQNIFIDSPTYKGVEIKETESKTESELKLEKEECIKNAEKNLILQRNINTKETLILSGLRGIILLIIFPLHFIYFKKYNK